MQRTYDYKLLIIYGPTATGKTALAIDLAKKYNGELISADSRQVYKGLDIGTGKLSIEQLNDSKVKRFKGYWIVDGIKIHGFDLVNLDQRFSVADFLKFAKSSMIQIIELNKLPIIVGGTGFYIKALIDGIDTVGIPVNQKLRKKLQKLSTADLYQKLLSINHERARSMNESDRANPRRLIRAIEIAFHKITTSEGSKPRLAAKRATSEVTNYPLPTTSYLLVGLTAPNDFLYQKADIWLETRLNKGMIGEVQNLINQNVNSQWLDNLGLEYRWITRHLLGKITKEEAIVRLKGDIHSFIRRQKTWFGKFKGIKLFDISQRNWSTKLEKTFKAWYYKDHGAR